MNCAPGPVHVPQTRLPAPGAVPRMVLVALPTRAEGPPTWFPKLLTPSFGPNWTRRPEESTWTFQNAFDRASVPPSSLCIAIAATALLGGVTGESVAVRLPPPPEESTADRVTVATPPLIVPENEIWSANPGVPFENEGGEAGPHWLQRKAPLFCGKSARSNVPANVILSPLIVTGMPEIADGVPKLMMSPDPNSRSARTVARCSARLTPSTICPRLTFEHGGSLHEAGMLRLVPARR